MPAIPAPTREGSQHELPNRGLPNRDLMNAFAREVRRGQRFEFGRNWRRFLAVLDEARIAAAERSLAEALGVPRLDGTTFLDVGSGSGLFSLAARRLGARVRSFDYDPQSVGCTAELKRCYFAGDADWTVEHGSVLDRTYMARLGTFDVVYSWGVLHHTGRMWEALGTVLGSVRPGGRLYVALYNDQGLRSQQWRKVKRLYCSGRLGRVAVASTFIPVFVAEGLLYDLVVRRNPLARYRPAPDGRGMSRVVDWLDWLGGYPFETAAPGEVLDFCRRRGFTLERLQTATSGCNEYVFRREGGEG